MSFDGRNPTNNGGENDSGDVVFLGESRSQEFRNKPTQHSQPADRNVSYQSYPPNQLQPFNASNQNQTFNPNFQSVNNITPQKNRNRSINNINQSPNQVFTPISSPQTPRTPNTPNTPRSKTYSLESLQKRSPNSFGNFQARSPTSGNLQAQYPAASRFRLPQVNNRQVTPGLQYYNNQSPRQNYPNHVRQTIPSASITPRPPHQSSTVACGYQINNSPSVKKILHVNGVTPKKKNRLDNDVVDITDGDELTDILPEVTHRIMNARNNVEKNNKSGEMKSLDSLTSKLESSENVAKATSDSQINKTNEANTNISCPVTSITNTVAQSTKDNNLPKNDGLVSQDTGNYQILAEFSDTNTLVPIDIGSKPSNEKGSNSISNYEVLAEICNVGHIFPGDKDDKSVAVNENRKDKNRDSMEMMPLLLKEPVTTVADSPFGSLLKQAVKKKRGRPRKSPEIYIENFEMRSTAETHMLSTAEPSPLLDDPVYSPEVHVDKSDSDEDYVPNPKKRKQKVKQSPVIKLGHSDINNSMDNISVLANLNQITPIDSGSAATDNSPAENISGRKLREKDNTTQLDDIFQKDKIYHKNNTISLQTSLTSQNISDPAVTRKMNNIEKKKPLALRLHHQQLSEDKRFKTFKSLSASVRKAKLNAKYKRKKFVASPEKRAALRKTSLLESSVETVPKKPASTGSDIKLPKKRGRKRIHPIKTKPDAVQIESENSIPVLLPVSIPNIQHENVSPVYCNNYSRTNKKTELKRKNSETSTRSPEKVMKFEKSQKKSVVTNVGAVVSGLFGEGFMSMADSNGFVINIRLDVEKKTSPSTSSSESQECKPERPVSPASVNQSVSTSTDTAESPLRLRKFDKWDPNFFTNAELCSILKKRIAAHPNLKDEVRKATVMESIEYARKMLDEL